MNTNMQDLLDNLTKPKGSLGRLEDIALKLSAIQNMVPPTAAKRGVWVFAGDHGVAEEGVSLYPQEVTAQMYLNIASGGAAISVLARHCGFDVRVIDAGMKADIEAPGGRILKPRSGSRNFAREDALTDDELSACLENGATLAREAVAAGYNLVAVGDMGIANTTTSTALVVAGGLELDDIVDRGTGIDDETLKHKRRVIEAAIALRGPFNGPEHILRAFGGLEFATMVGFILGLKGTRVGCLIDGFPVSAAAYIAYLMDPGVTEYLFAGHRSRVKGHQHILDAMGLEPLLSLDMRLGEGTGAVIGGFLVHLATMIAKEMATFDSASVSRSDQDEEDY